MVPRTARLGLTNQGGTGLARRVPHDAGGDDRGGRRSSTPAANVGSFPGGRHLRARPGGRARQRDGGGLVSAHQRVEAARERDDPPAFQVRRGLELLRLHPAPPPCLLAARLRYPLSGRQRRARSSQGRTTVPLPPRPTGRSLRATCGSCSTEGRRSTDVWVTDEAIERRDVVVSYRAHFHARRPRGTRGPRPYRGSRAAPRELVNSGRDRPLLSLERSGSTRDASSSASCSITVYRNKDTPAGEPCGGRAADGPESRSVTLIFPVGRAVAWKAFGGRPKRRPSLITPRAR
jgi:hypothetical protein